MDVLVEFDGPTTSDAHMGLLVFLEDLLGCRVDVVSAKGPAVERQVLIIGEAAAGLPDW